MVLVGHNDSVTAANYSPDGKRIVTSSNDRTARVWDAASGNLLAILPGHTAAVNWASFSADGKRVATASGDSSARVYLVDFDEVLALAKQLLPVDRGN
jgi:WD40 repeat protein